MSVVAISAVSSFSGLWIADALQKAGHSVMGLCAGPDVSSYQGTLRGRRLRRLKASGIELAFGLRAETGAMASWLAREKIDYFILHHHFMNHFRSAQYDLAEARRVGLEPLPQLLKALIKSGAKGVVFSGTYIEALPLARSPYGFSKAEVWRTLTELGAEMDLSVGKVIIANPIGPLENADRMIPSLLRTSLNDRATFTLLSPEGQTYPIPIQLLGAAYVNALRRLESGLAPLETPSLGPLSNRELAEMTLRELVDQRLGLTPCSLALNPATQELASVEFREQNCACDWAAFWDFYASVLRTEFLSEKGWSYAEL